MHTNGAGLLVCPECAGYTRRDGLMDALPRGGGWEAVRQMPVTIALMSAALVAFAVQAMGVGATGLLGGTAGSALAQRWGIFGPAVADGEWWRLMTHAFVHGGLIHLGFNLVILWWLGRMLEPELGAGRYLGVFLASVLGGGALALLLDPTVLGVGMSGGIFGLMACALVLQWRRSGSPMHSPVWGLFVLNLIVTFAIPGVSIGGHLGGAIGGAICGALIAAGEMRRIDVRIVTAALGALVVMVWALGVALA